MCVVFYCWVTNSPHYDHFIYSFLLSCKTCEQHKQKTESNINFYIKSVFFYCCFPFSKIVVVCLILKWKSITNTHTVNQLFKEHFIAGVFLIKIKKKYKNNVKAYTTFFWSFALNKSKQKQKKMNWRKSGELLLTL